MLKGTLIGLAFCFVYNPLKLVSLGSCSDRVSLYHYEPCLDGFFPKTGVRTELIEEPNLHIVEHFVGVGLSIEAGGIPPFRSLRPILNSRQWPYRTCGRVLALEGSLTGTGTLVGPRHFLTAAHNLYDRSEKKWVNKVVVCIAMNGIEKPYGEIEGIGYYSYKNLWDAGDAHELEAALREFDMALIVLKDPIGDMTGYSGVLAINGFDFNDREVEIAGYPSETADGSRYSPEDVRMRKGSYLLTDESVREEGITHGIEAFHGMSGSSIRLTNAGDFRNYVIGIHTRSGGRGLPVSSKKLADLANWINLSSEVANTQYPSRALHRGEEITSFCYSKKWHWFAVAVREKIYFYDHSLENPMLFEGHTEPVRTMAFHPDENSLISGGYDGRIIRWNFLSSSPKTPHQYLKRNREVRSLAFNKSGTHFAAGGYGGYDERERKTMPSGIYIWDYGRNEIVGQVLTHESSICSLVFRYSPDNEVFFGDSSHKIYLWNSTLETGIVPNKWQGHHEDIVTTLSFCPGDPRGYGIGKSDKLASGSRDHTVKLWIIGRSFKVLRGHKSSISSLAFNPSGSLLASGSQDGEIRLWDYTRDVSNCLHTCAEHKFPVVTIVFSPDSQYLISGSFDKGIVSKDLLTILDSHGNPKFADYVRPPPHRSELQSGVGVVARTLGKGVIRDDDRVSLVPVTVREIAVPLPEKKKSCSIL